MARELAPKTASAKKTLAKKDFSLDDFKEELGLTQISEVGEKPRVWIPVSTALQDALGVPGIAKGFFTIVRGFSNTGKSTSMLECVRGCQQLGIMPIVIDTESNISWSHARTMGVEIVQKLNKETGELTDSLADGMYVTCDFLIQRYGRREDKTREVATIENVAEFMNELLNMQAAGKLPRELCFLWDSAGTLDCEKGVKSNSGNNMWNAGAMEAAFRSLINQRIPLSRMANKEYTNTFFVVQKIWLDSSQGNGVIKHKGGEAFFYGARFIIHFGGITSHGTKRHIATAKGRSYVFGTEAKISVAKNQITDSVYDGTKIISTAHGFIGSDAASIEAYKKEHKDFLLKQLEVEGYEGGDDFDIEIISENVPDESAFSEA